MLWQCPCRPQGGPKIPKCNLQARLGWTAEGTDREADKVMNWITRMARAVWEKRYYKKGEEDGEKDEAREARYWESIGEEIRGKDQEEEDKRNNGTGEDWSDEEETEEEEEEEEEKEEEGYDPHRGGGKQGRMQKLLALAEGREEVKEEKRQEREEEKERESQGEGAAAPVLPGADQISSSSTAQSLLLEAKETEEK